MEYQKLKKSILDFSKDIIRKPFSTIGICLVLVLLYLISLVLPKYIEQFLDNKNKTQENTLVTQSVVATTTILIADSVNSIKTQYLADSGNNYEGEAYSIKASYPVFGIEKLDNKIVELIDTHVAIAKYGDSQHESHFSSSFEQPYIDSKIISVEIHLYHYGNYEFDRGEERVIGINYDRIHNKFYSIDDLGSLTGLSLKKSAAIVSEKLSKENEIEINVEAKPENFSNFIINKDEVVFIYQMYQVAGRPAGIPRAGVKRIL